MAKSIIFRADGNTKDGLGHIYRLLALAEIVKGYYEFLFLITNTSNASIIPSNYNIHYVEMGINVNNEPSWISSIYNPNNYFIIADGYNFDTNYQKKLKREGYSLVYIDDLANGHFHAELVINHAINANRKDYKSEKHTKFALGNRYALLRKEFLDAAKLKWEEPHSNEALICFGGADPYDLTGKALAGILQFKEFEKVHVILGSANKQVGVQSMKRKFPEKVLIYKDLGAKDLIDIFITCKLAIVPSSTILYEICCLGIPAISGFYTSNQIETYRGFLKAGAIFGAADIMNFTKEDFVLVISNYIKEKPIVDYRLAQSKIIDGYSNIRLLKKIHLINLSFRKAQLEDIDLVYGLSNDPLVRKNSYDSDPINKENHQIWYNQMLREKGSSIYIAEVNENVAGMVRYKSDKESTIVGVVVSAKYRGLGLASEYLRQTSKYIFAEGKTKITAYIKTSNKASIRSFEKASYKSVKKTIIQNIPSEVYELEKKYIRQ